MQKGNNEEKIGTEASVTELSDEMLDDVTGGGMTQDWRELKAATRMKSKAAQMNSGASQMKSAATQMKN